MQTYSLREPIHGELHDAFLGRIAFDFPGGEIAPRSEHDERALDHLVTIGVAIQLPDTDGNDAADEEE